MYKNYFKKIGNTPLVKFNKSNIYLKLEGHNPSGSIKDRSITNMVKNINQGHGRDPNKPYCLVTSGSAGTALYNLHKQTKMKNDIIIVIPLKYSTKKIPKLLIEKNDSKIHYDFNTIDISNKGVANIVLMNDIFMNVFFQTKNIVCKNEWILLDQHYNEDCVDIHQNTVNEILIDCPDVTDVVCATGTGGTAAGLIKYLPKNVKVHSRPSISGEIEGLSDVGRYNNFCKPSKISNYYEDNYKLRNAIKYKNFINNRGFQVGYSTGASYWLAKQINKPNKKIVIISPDGIIRV